MSDDLPSFCVMAVPDKITRLRSCGLPLDDHGDCGRPLGEHVSRVCGECPVNAPHTCGAGL